MWSPHGLGVRRENRSADGAGRKSVEMVGRCWLLWGAPLSRRARPFQEGRASFREGAPLLLT